MAWLARSYAPMTLPPVLAVSAVLAALSAVPAVPAAPPRRALLASLHPIVGLTGPPVARSHRRSGSDWADYCESPPGGLVLPRVRSTEVRRPPRSGPVSWRSRPSLRCFRGPWLRPPRPTA